MHPTERPDRARLAQSLTHHDASWPTIAPARTQGPQGSERSSLHHLPHAATMSWTNLSSASWLADTPRVPSAASKRRRRGRPPLPSDAAHRWTSSMMAPSAHGPVHVSWPGSISTASPYGTEKTAQIRASSISSGQPPGQPSGSAPIERSTNSREASMLALVGGCVTRRTWRKGCRPGLPVESVSRSRGARR